MAIKQRYLKTLYVRLFFLLILNSCFTAVYAQTRATVRRPPAPTAVARKTLPSVVLLLAEAGKAEKLGSGFFIESDLIATNFHVVKGASSILARVVGQETFFRVAVVGIDKENDVAILRCQQAKGIPLQLGESAKLAIGDVIYAVGNPEGLEGTFSNGIVSSKRSNGHVQITAPISHGSSGGPVLDQFGSVIGVATYSYTDGQNLNFAVPVEYISSLVSEIKSKKVGDGSDIDRFVNAYKEELLAKGEAFANRGDHQSAIKAYQEAVDIDPSISKAWFKMAVSYMALGQPSSAFPLFRLAIRLNPDNPTYHFLLGFHYAHAGAASAAVAECTILSELRSDLFKSLRMTICSEFSPDSTPAVKSLCSNP